MLSICQILFSVVLFCQQDSLKPKTSSEVKELELFHEIIYPIWHTAYPEKDYAALKSYVSEINKLDEALYKVELPGILREKRPKWEAGVKEFKNSVDEYNKAATGEDNNALLNAAEVLHAKYEMLVRTIIPVLKEVDEFHQLLYIVYDKDLPGKQFDIIKSKAAAFLQKAEAITKATLSKRLAKKTDEFKVATAELLVAANQLAEICRNNEDEKIDKAVNHLHSKYQEPEIVFDQK